MKLYNLTEQSTSIQKSDNLNSIKNTRQQCKCQMECLEQQFFQILNKKDTFGLILQQYQNVDQNLSDINIFYWKQLNKKIPSQLPASLNSQIKLQKYSQFQQTLKSMEQLYQQQKKQRKRGLIKSLFQLKDDNQIKGLRQKQYFIASKKQIEMPHLKHRLNSLITKNLRLSQHQTVRKHCLQVHSHKKAQFLCCSKYCDDGAIMCGKQTCKCALDHFKFSLYQQNLFVPQSQAKHNSQYQNKLSFIMTVVYFFTTLTLITPQCATLPKLHTKKCILMTRNVVFLYKSEKIRLRKTKNKLQKQLKTHTKNTPQ